MSTTDIPWGPTGETVYDRTYSRTKADGAKETWPETVRRVAEGNLALVHGNDWDAWPVEAKLEYGRLVNFMQSFKILPAGRHLWASGVKGRQYLFNCHVSGWGEKLSDHFEFSFMRLMEGGGVGANYSSRFLEPYGAPRRSLNVHIVCDPEHPDYQEMKDAGLLSEQFDSEWHGAFEVEDSREGWATALVNLLDVYMTDREVKHADRVYDVSRVRSKGARLKTFGGSASGPGPFARMMLDVERVLNQCFEYARADEFFGFRSHIEPTDAMEIDHAIAVCVVSGGNRRSARMAICHWDDETIEDFLACKRDSGLHWTTNISVEVDREFFDALDDELHEKHEKAQWVLTEVVTGMLTNGEPGFWNSTLSNHGEPNEVIATNPCGEIALEAWENCNLGHVNLDAFAPTREGGPVDMLGLIEAHRLVTRFLIRATYGDVTDPKQGEKLARNRRIGVGHFGVQGFLAKQGIRYSHAPMSSFRRQLDEFYEAVRKEARDYAFALRIPEPVKATTVAPTGTIAKMPGATEGIHPIYARYFERRVRFSLADEDQWKQVHDLEAQGFAIEQDRYDPSGNTWIVVFPTKEMLVEQVEALGLDPDIVESADEIGVADMLAFQRMYQAHYADNAVSFTVNVPAEEHQQAAMLTGAPVPGPSKERLEAVTQAVRVHLPGLKGTTLMLDGSRPQAPYTRITKAQYELATAKAVSDGIDEDCASGACPVR